MSFDFEAFVKKYYVHPETIAFFLARAAENPKPYYDVGVEEARRTSLEVCTKYSGPDNFDGTETEVIIPSPEVPEGLPSSVYRPKACDNLEAPPIVVYFHGGGNTVGSRKSHEATCKAIASQVPCIFVNVEYRLSPEHKYPANLDDTVVAVTWVAANKTAVGGTSSSKLGVSGDSAGARLAAVACHEIKQGIDFEVLVYPSVGGGPWPSMQEFEEGPVLAKPTYEWFLAQYGVPESEYGSARASVILNKDFSYLPPTLIIVADLDPLRDGCYAYHEKLKEAGVKVELKTIKGVPHAFWNLPGAFPETCGEAYNVTVDFIRRCSGMH